MRAKDHTITKSIFKNTYSSRNEYFELTGDAVGLKGSTIKTGRGNDQIGIDVFGGEQAIGLKNSYLNSGSGADKINIVVSSKGGMLFIFL